jgi:hypothetical protein
LVVNKVASLVIVSAIVLLKRPTGYITSTLQQAYNNHGNKTYLFMHETPIAGSSTMPSAYCTNCGGDRNYHTDTGRCKNCGEQIANCPTIRQKYQIVTGPPVIEGNQAGQ